MKISRKNWETSKEKWADNSPIAQNIKDKKLFNCVDGWENARVRTGCGYCWEVFCRCQYCNLYPKTCAPFLNDNNNLFGRFVWCFITRDYTVKSRPAFARAEKLRKRIYKAILADEPNVYEESE